MESLCALPSRRTVLFIIAGFFLLGLLVYGRSLRNEFVRWDDGMLIYENPAVREISPWSLKHVFTTYDPELYIPLTFLSYQIDYRLWGTNPLGYHLMGLLLHIVNALLVMWLLWLLFRQGWAAIFCGLLFLVHPLHTEAVAWASGRKDVLSTFFFLLSLIAYLYHAGSSQRWPYVLSLLFFLLGLLSKAMVITLPFVLLLIDWRGGQQWSRRIFIGKIPYVGLAALFGIVALFGKADLVAHTTLLEKILMACKSTVFYLQKLFLPTGLSVLYPYTKTVTITSPDFFVPVIVVLLLLLLAWVSWRPWRDMTCGILFFLITLIPTFTNFAKGGDFDIYIASDRYAYIPSVGVLLLVGFLLQRVEWRRAQEGLWTLDFGQRALRTIVIAVGTMVIVFLGFLAYHQSLVWRDTGSLFQNVLAHYPDSSYIAYNNIGNMHRLRGDLDRSIEEYTKANSIRPHARTYSNLGAAYRKKGMTQEALGAYQEALKVDPESGLAHIGLGIIHTEQGQWAEAEAAYREGLRLDPTEEVGYANLGVLYVNQGRIDEAVMMLHAAVARNPVFAEAWYNLGIALTKMWDADGAINAYREVIHIAPAFIPAQINLGILLHQTGDVRGARRQFEIILQIDPQNRAARSALEQMADSR